MNSPKPTEPRADLEAMSYEEALSGLEGIVAHLERGDLALEHSMQQFERGIALSRICAQKLAEAEAKIQKLVETGEGEGTVAPLQISTGGTLE